MSEHTLTDGDIFHWRYKDEKPEDCGAYRRYHCRSQIAVFENGVLRDTYWGSAYDGRLDPAEVVLDFQGNAHEMLKIHAGERVFYKPEDVVDMNHPNNSRADVYVKGPRDAETMKAYYEYAIFTTKQKIAGAYRRIEECEKALAVIAEGDLTHYFPVYSP